MVKASFDNLEKQLMVGCEGDASRHEEHFEECKAVARHYAMLENAIAVLSDLSSDRSFISYGSLASRLGIKHSKQEEEVDSIWEKTVLDHIHPDDLLEKCAWELRFLSILESISVDEKRNYILQHPVRMKNADGAYHDCVHRVMYLHYNNEGKAVFALCLYNAAISGHESMAGIVNTLDGNRVANYDEGVKDMLSEREKEVLRLVGDGLSSKMIANRLCISVHTVNGHRQNLLQKLHVANSSEAYKVAKRLNII